MNVLELKDVVKTYQNHVAVNQVSFGMEEGCIFGLLGPNGAGKTSLIRIITSITQADSGQVFLNGNLLEAGHTAEIGYMPEERGLYKKMKVGEQLMYLAQLKGLSKAKAKSNISYWLNKFGIEDWWTKKVEELSKGMQQKIQFISTVVHEPRLLILDEPFSGLDPINSNLIKDEIYELNQKGTSIIFSTHRMEQVEEICEFIVLINGGANVLEGKVADIKNDFKENKFRIEFEGNLPTNIDEKVHILERNGSEMIVQLESDHAANLLLKYLLDNNLYIISFNEILPSINEIFIKQVGGKSDE